MREQDAITQVMKATEARQGWSELLNKVFRTNTRIVVEKNGIPVAAIISPQELERFERLEAQRAARFQPLLEIAHAFKDVPPEELEQEVAQALAEVRQETRRAGTKGDKRRRGAEKKETGASRP